MIVHFADFEQLKKVILHLAEFEFVKKLFLIILGIYRVIIHIAI